MIVDIPEYGTSVEFPDETPQEEISLVLQKNFPSKTAPSFGQSVGTGVKNFALSIPRSIGTGLAAGKESVGAGFDAFNKVMDSNFADPAATLANAGLGAFNLVASPFTAMFGAGQEFLNQNVPRVGGSVEEILHAPVGSFEHLTPQAPEGEPALQALRELGVGVASMSPFIAGGIGKAAYKRSKAPPTNIPKGPRFGAGPEGIAERYAPLRYDEILRPDVVKPEAVPPVPKGLLTEGLPFQPARGGQTLEAMIRDAVGEKVGEVLKKYGLEPLAEPKPPVSVIPPVSSVEYGKAVIEEPSARAAARQAGLPSPSSSGPALPTLQAFPFKVGEDVVTGMGFPGKVTRILGNGRVIVEHPPDIPGAKGALKRNVEVYRPEELRALKQEEAPASPPIPATEATPIPQKPPVALEPPPQLSPQKPLGDILPAEQKMADIMGEPQRPPQPNLSKEDIATSDRLLQQLPPEEPPAPAVEPAISKPPPKVPPAVAAVVMKDGKIFTGVTHPEAMNAATSAGYKYEDLQSANHFVKNGKLITREQAGKEAGFPNAVASEELQGLVPPDIKAPPAELKQPKDVTSLLEEVAPTGQGEAGPPPVVTQPGGAKQLSQELTKSPEGIQGGMAHAVAQAGEIISKARNLARPPKALEIRLNNIYKRVVDKGGNVSDGLQAMAEATAKASKGAVTTAEARAQLDATYNRNYLTHEGKLPPEPPAPTPEPAKLPPRPPKPGLASEQGAVALINWGDLQDAGRILKEKLRLPMTKAGTWKGEEVYARLQNIFHPDEKAIYEAAGLQQALAGKQVNEKQLAEILRDNGPRLETRKLEAAKAEMGEAAQAIAAIEHKLDTNYPNWATRDDLPQAALDLIERKQDLEFVARKEPWISESATARYTTVNPKPLDQMPGAVDLLVRIPIKGTPAEGSTLVGVPTTGIKYESFHYPAEGKNLVAHVRGYMETLPDGRKVFHVFEAQSDWAQAVRKKESRLPTAQNEFERDMISQHAKETDPLLPHYERLAIKAAIEHARKEGATHIAISDYRSVALTEGWDRIQQQAVDWVRSINSDIDGYRNANDAYSRGVRFKEIQQEKLIQFDSKFGRYGAKAKITEGGDLIMTVQPFEGGGSLHYDRTLPKIAEELTGSKGERVSFGEHQNAFEQEQRAATNLDEPSRIVREKGARKDLIFKNPDGTPKTDISARLYPIEGAQKSFTTFGSDKALAPERNAPAKAGMAGGGETKAVSPTPPEPPSFPTRGELGGIDPTILKEVVGKAKNAAGAVKDLVERLTPKSSEFGPAFIFRQVGQLPDFQEHKVAKEIFSRPSGIGKVPILGAIFDPRYTVREPVEKAIITWAAERAMGESVATVLSLHRSLKESPFTVEEGKIANITATKAGTSTYPSDFFETYRQDPTAYKLTPEQETYTKRTIKLLEDARALAEKHGVLDIVDGETDALHKKGFAFPRIVIDPQAETKSGKKIEPLIGGSRIGSKQFFQRQRLYPTEEVGAKSVKYEPDLEKRVHAYIARTYRAIADNRLINDPEIGGKTPAERMPMLREYFKEDLASGDMKPADLTELARHPILRFGEGPVQEPAFQGKVYPVETANAINKFFGESSHRWVRHTSTVNNAIKSLEFSLDFSPMVLQGQVLFFRNPRVWARSTGNMFQAFADPKVQSKYFNEPGNKQAALELASLGVKLGSPFEYAAGAAKGEPITRVPIIGKAFEAAGRAFATYSDVAVMEMWKALRETTPKDQRAAVAETLQNLVSRGRMEEIGVNPARATGERVLFLAPTFLRGSTGFVANLAEKGVSGEQTQRAMISWAVGWMALYTAYALGTGMSRDDYLERLDPSSSNFMTVPVDVDGKKWNVGLGGPYRSYMRLIGDMTETAIEHPRDYASGSVEINPISKWLRGKAAPVPSLAIDVAFGKDFLGRPTTIPSALAERGTPTSLQPFLRGKGTPATSVGGDVVPGVAGMQSFPASPISENARGLLRDKARMRKEVETIGRAAAQGGSRREQFSLIEQAIEDYPPAARRQLRVQARRLVIQINKGRRKAESQANR